MTKIKLSALACAIFVGGQQLVAEDLNNIIDLGNYSYQTVDINNETKIITGTSEGVVINVKNNGELRSEVSDFFYTDINIKKNSNATFENEVWLDSPKLHIKNNSNAIFKNDVSIENPNFHINDSTAVFNKALYMWDDGDDRWPVIEQDNDFSGGNLSLDNSTLDIKGEAEFEDTNVLINHGSTAKIDNLYGYESKIYVVNDSELEINKDAIFAGTHLIVKDNSNTTINGALIVEDFGNGKYAKGGIKIDKSNLKVAGEVYFHNSDLVVQNGSKVMFNDNFTMKNGNEKSIIILDNGSEINIKGDFENHGVIYYGASADSAPKITVDGKATLKDTTEIGIYATSGEISNLNQAVFF